MRAAIGRLVGWVLGLAILFTLAFFAFVFFLVFRYEVHSNGGIENISARTAEELGSTGDGWAQAISREAERWAVGTPTSVSGSTVRQDPARTPSAAPQVQVDMRQATPIPAHNPAHPITFTATAMTVNPGGRTQLSWDVGQGAREVWLYSHPVVDQGEAPIEKTHINSSDRYSRRPDVSTFYWIEATYTDGSKSAKGLTICVGDPKCADQPGH